MNIRFFKCSKCGNIITSSNESITCCGEKLTELIPNKTEAATEKHIPVLNIEGTTAFITVGEILHPMLEEHYISWIYVITNKRVIKYDLLPNNEPKVELPLLKNEELIKVYAYCNTHGLWVNESN